MSAARPSRRSVLVGAGAALLSPPALAARPEVLAFDVLREGSPIGAHVFTISRDGERRRVDIAIDLQVRFGFVTLFRYVHRGGEIWEGDRLLQLYSTTDDDGRRFRVSIRPVDGGLAVEGKDGRRVVPPDTLPSSWWNPAVDRASALIDTQDGELEPIGVLASGEDDVPVSGGSVRARRFDVTGRLALSLWYDTDDRLARLSFSARGSKIDYLRRA